MNENEMRNNNKKEVSSFTKERMSPELKGKPISKRRLRYIEEKFDRFLNGVFKEGEMIEVIIKPCSPNALEVTFKDVSELQEGGKEKEGKEEAK